MNLIHYFTNAIANEGDYYMKYYTIYRYTYIKKKTTENFK